MSKAARAHVPFFSLKNQRFAEVFCWIGFTAAVFSCGIFLGERIEEAWSCQKPAIHTASTP